MIGVALDILQFSALFQLEDTDKNGSAKIKTPENLWYFQFQLPGLNWMYLLYIFTPASIQILDILRSYLQQLPLLSRIKLLANPL